MKKLLVLLFVLTPTLAQTFPAPEARQGVAVDQAHFYAIDNRTIGKYDKRTGELVARFESPEDGEIIHLDSGVVIEGKLYCAHSNYPDWPMTSSVEIFDAETLEHIDSHSFGINWGSLTWLDFHDGYWWAGFANYNRVFGESPLAYGNKHRTMVVKLDQDFGFLEGWVLPDEMLERFDDMSNSGGSWGPDGRLYLTGHDLAEVYAVELPKAGSILKWADSYEAPITGQGIAWDRGEAGWLYGINREERQVLRFQLEPAE